MKRKYRSVSLKDWNLKATEKMNSLVLEAAAEALQLALDDTDTDALMPAVWGNSDGFSRQPCDDPLTVYFEIALGDAVSEDPVWATSITKMLDSYINECAKDGSFSGGLMRIRDALRELADRIDNAVASRS